MRMSGLEALGHFSHELAKMKDLLAAKLFPQYPVCRARLACLHVGLSICRANPRSRSAENHASISSNIRP